MKAYLTAPILSSLVIAVLTVIPGEIASAQSLPDIRRQYLENNLATSELQQKKWKELLEPVRVEPMEPLGKGLAERLPRDWQREQEAGKEGERLIKQLLSPPKEPVVWTYTSPPLRIFMPPQLKHDPVQGPGELSSAARREWARSQEQLRRQRQSEFNRVWRDLDRAAANRQNEAAARRTACRNCQEQRNLEMRGLQRQAERRQNEAIATRQFQNRRSFDPPKTRR